MKKRDYLHHIAFDVTFRFNGKDRPKYNRETEKEIQNLIKVLIEVRRQNYIELSDGKYDCETEVNFIESEAIKE